MIASKKAMSPLVATVLLIAFAVALGVMIMNLSGPTPGREATKICQDISITSAKVACYKDSALYFSIRNNGKYKVDGVQMVIESPDGNLVYDVPSSSMIPGETIDRSRRMLFPEAGSIINFYPLMIKDGEYVTCDIGISQSDVANC